MKVYFNTTTEYSRKKNVNYRNTNIHNHFNAQNYNFEKHNKHSIKFEGISKNVSLLQKNVFLNPYLKNKDIAKYTASISPVLALANGIYYKSSSQKETPQQTHNKRLERFYLNNIPALGNNQLKEKDIKKLEFLTDAQLDATMLFLSLNKSPHHKPNIDDIVKAVSNISAETYPVLDNLSKQRATDGSKRFDYHSLIHIAPHLTPQNTPFIKTMTEMKETNGTYRFDGGDIAYILRYFTPENSSFIANLCTMKKNNSAENDGKYRFNVSDIKMIASACTTQKLPYIKEFSEMKKNSDAYRFLTFEILTLANLCTQEHAPFVKELLEIQSKTGGYVFRADDCKALVEKISPEELPFIKELAQMTDRSGEARFAGNTIISIMTSITPENKDFIKEFINCKRNNGEYRFFNSDIQLFLSQKVRKTNFIKQLMTTDTEVTDFSFIFLDFYNNANINIKETEQKVAQQISLMRANPDRYVSGNNFKSEAEKLKAVNKFISAHRVYITLAASILDKDSLNNLMQKRFEQAKDYMISLGVHFDLLITLKGLFEAKNIDGKPFTGNQKLEFIDLVSAYENHNLSFDKINQMIKDGIANPEELNFDLFSSIMKKAGLTEKDIIKIPLERLKKWDFKYIHFLAKEMSRTNNEDFQDIFKLGNFSKDFKTDIHSPLKKYGQANLKTKTMFETEGMDYDKWLNPSKKHEINLTTKGKNTEQLSLIAKQLTEDIETLRKSPFIKKHIDSDFKKYLKNDEFIIPTQITTNKKMLADFVDSIIKKLDKIWTLAKKNLDDPTKVEKARNTLTILDHLKQRQQDILSISSTKEDVKEIDLTIKMWDRNPQKDIFQGNYSTCCIGLGRGNGSAMPLYLLNTSFNMIELIDNTKGETIGNALCYFAKDSSGKNSLIIDNIEIKTTHTSNVKTGLKIRNAICEYASKIAKDVTGKEDTPIYLGNKYNDIPTLNLEQENQEISFFGEIGIDDVKPIYLDLYGGWVNKSGRTKVVSTLKLK